MKTYSHINYHLPTNLEATILKLGEEKLSSSFSAKTTAQSVLQLSDFYIDNPDGKTPWEDKSTLRAYLFYYFPLNFLRSSAVFHQLSSLDLFNSQSLSDLAAKFPIEIDELGSGFGSCSMALFSQNPQIINQINKITYYEVSEVASRWHQWLFSETFKDFSDLIQIHSRKSSFEKKFPGEKSERASNLKAKKILMASYALTEIPQHEKILKNYDFVIILEPSTSADGRKLMQLRQLLIGQGHTILAPCLHQSACPLLTQSQKDWCHDRIHWKTPKWFQEMENHLPIKNQTLTFSYLVSAKKDSWVSVALSLAPLSNATPLADATTLASQSYTISLASLSNTVPKAMPSFVRIVGDTLVEKGKNRQLICYDQDRRFFTWMHKDFDKKGPDEISRGSIVPFPTDYELKSNEIRIKN